MRPGARRPPRGDPARGARGGGATQPLIPWINRPTYQQVNEIQARTPR